MQQRILLYSDGCARSLSLCRQLCEALLGRGRVGRGSKSACGRILSNNRISLDGIKLTTWLDSHGGMRNMKLCGNVFVKDAKSICHSRCRHRRRDAAE